MLLGNLYLGCLASLRGDHGAALEHYQKLMAFMGRIGTPGLRGAANLVGATPTGPWGVRPSAQVLPAWLEAAFHASRTLCNLGRVDEARQVLALAGPPCGEYDGLLRVLAERYVDFCVGTPSLGDAELQSFTTWALGLRGTWGLLALAAWQHARRGDLASATRLLDEERGRPNAARLETLMPPLARFMAAPGFNRP
jgi:hypothetical protein